MIFKSTLVVFQKACAYEFTRNSALLQNKIYLQMHRKKRNIQESGYCLLIKIMGMISCDLLRMLISLRKENIMNLGAQTSSSSSSEYRVLFCFVSALMRTNIYFVNNVLQKKKKKKKVHIPAIFRNKKVKMVFWEKEMHLSFSVLWSIWNMLLIFACIRNSPRKKKKSLIYANSKSLGFLLFKNLERVEEKSIFNLCCLVIECF